MSESYQPESDFICMVANDEIPLTGSVLAEQNLQLLIEYMRDPVVSNRDWATLLVAGTDIDTPEVRTALLLAADDEHVDVRAEAIEGLAMRDLFLALPFVEGELSRPECGYGVVTAAAMIADARFVQLLKRFDVDSGDTCWNEHVAEAIAACQTGAAIRRL